MVRTFASDRSQTYRREARRLRGRYARQPVQLYRSLRALSDRQDAIALLGETSIEIPDEADRFDASPLRADLPGSAAQFARYVAGQLQGDVLRYSGRLHLLQTADSLGIPRFQANLIIALVQHEMGTPAHQTTAPRASLWTSPLLVMLLIQLLIAAAIWAVFFH